MTYKFPDFSFDRVIWRDIIRILTIYLLIIKWNNIKVDKQKILTEEEQIKNKIRAFLKERKWTKYHDTATDVNVSITESQRETIDKTQLKLLLSNTDYNSVVKITHYERLNILTKETRDRIKKLVR